MWPIQMCFSLSYMDLPCAAAYCTHCTFNVLLLITQKGGDVTWPTAVAFAWLALIPLNHHGAGYRQISRWETGLHKESLSLAGNLKSGTDISWQPQTAGWNLSTESHLIKFLFNNRRLKQTKKGLKLETAQQQLQATLGYLHWKIPIRHVHSNYQLNESFYFM